MASTLRRRREETKGSATYGAEGGHRIGDRASDRGISYTRAARIPNLNTAIKEGWGPAQIIDANFGNAFSTSSLGRCSGDLRLLSRDHDVEIRLCFGMARDDTLPGSKVLRKVNPELHTPVWSCIVVGSSPHSVHPVRRRRGDRDRGDGDDLLSYLIGTSPCCGRDSRAGRR